MKVHGKVMVVTGGGNGMGREIVLNLLSKGARVAAVDINERALAETAALAGPQGERMSTHVVNLADREAVAALPAQVIAAHGAVDGIINNAGIIQPFVRVNELDFDAIERVMAVNFDGTLYMVKSFLPRLLERPEAHIANVSSMGGFLPVPGQSIYGASKAAVKLLTEALHSELQGSNVGVTVIFPGAIRTNIASNSGLERMPGAESSEAARSFKPLDAAKAAEIIVNAIEVNAYRVLVGSDARAMDLLYRLSPSRAAGFIFKRMKSLLS